MRTAADIRMANAYDVVRTLRASGDASRRELAALTGLSFQTVATICSQLLDHGVLREAARAKPAAGRPTTRLALDPDHGRLLGVDLTETYVHVETFTTALDPVSSTELELDYHDRTPRVVVGRLREALGRELGTLGEHPLLGVGLSVPGQLDRDGGTSVHAPNWGWRNVQLLRMLDGLADAPFHLDNPLKATVAAELWSRPEHGTTDVVIVTLGTGVGFGAALSGRVLRGRTDSAGEWGHSVIVAGGRQCRCGSRGCVEAYVGAGGILQTLREVAPDSPALHGEDQAATVRALAEAYRAGDGAAVETVERTSYYLGIALGGIVNVLNPEVIILSSWVARDLGDALLERLRPHLAAHALSVPLLAVSVEVDHSRGNRPSLGVATLVLERHLRALTTPEGTAALGPDGAGRADAPRVG
ncbi:putative NBD/HSP70 family sugar kinase [Cellulosimicrobium cellulans]|uniref:ROK family protein n=1 Tax=Cellulosimicrobium cellulans TaxID=1710 RepID=UPI00195E7478|nr:ROK family protein [Cellulosimicrobium cellulans]MBM7818737.1 putative NBD/HSP70 family sugar kinase [Cellulosimicrobium cellulans]